MSRASRGVVAAGHQVTAEAAQEILMDGGNAFDAVLAAMLTACVAEPVLASLGGGGFLMAHPTDAPPRVFDFFVQTPQNKRPLSDIDFRPILADFGTAQQEFHIGMGTIATPGSVAGLFEVHSALGILPLRRICEPAMRTACDGLEVNSFHHYISTIIAPILKSSPEAFSLYASRKDDDRLASEGEQLTNPDFADLLDSLAREGPALFYRGEPGQHMVGDCIANGGWLTQKDLDDYQVVIRPPLTRDYQGWKLFLNPPPSVGGTLLAFILGLLDLESPNGVPDTRTIAEAMARTQLARRDEGVDQGLDDTLVKKLLDPETLSKYRHATQGMISTRGTTHISVADVHGNLASLTLSNGEGSGYVLPGTGIMLNNMLGEEDLNATGFHQWQSDRRVASMMSPSLALNEQGDWYAIGSGGSNRIRSAILQTLLALIEHDGALAEAVRKPRIHVENDTLSMEAGIPEATIEELTEIFPRHHLWPGLNLFFGGAHSVVRHSDGRLDGAGDPRRGGIAYFA